jgi:hypothetical protein
LGADPSADPDADPSTDLCANPGANHRANYGTKYRAKGRTKYGTNAERSEHLLGLGAWIGLRDVVLAGSHADEAGPVGDAVEEVGGPDRESAAEPDHSVEAGHVDFLLVLVDSASAE